MGRMPCNDRSRDWSDIAASHRMPRIGVHYQKLGERHGTESPLLSHQKEPTFSTPWSPTSSLQTETINFCCKLPILWYFVKAALTKTRINNTSFAISHLLAIWPQTSHLISLSPTIASQVRRLIWHPFHIKVRSPTPHKSNTLQVKVSKKWTYSTLPMDHRKDVKQILDAKQNKEWRGVKIVPEKLWLLASPNIVLNHLGSPRKFKFRVVLRRSQTDISQKTPCRSKWKSFLKESTVTLGLKETPQIIFENNKYVAKATKHTRKKGIRNKNHRKQTCKDFRYRNDQRHI